MINSYQLFSFLHSLNLLSGSPLWWWPNCGDFEVIIGVILTQNTKWENVQKSLQNLQNAKILTPQVNEKNLLMLAQADPHFIAYLIAPSGFANQKSSRLVRLSQNILQDFGSYEEFVSRVSADWLIAQKGIGQESRDAILNYACLREVMVVDKYTHKLLCQYGYEMHEYEEMQGWLCQGIIANFDAITQLYPDGISLAQIYARFHGKIVEYGKKGFKPKMEDVNP